MTDTADSFSVDFAIDEPNRILRVTARGLMQSDVFVDRCIAFFLNVDSPWRYNRLYDQTGCRGFASFDDLSRMSRVLNPLWAKAESPTRVAVANPSRLVEARMPLVSQLYEQPNHRVFATVEDAEDWLIDGRHFLGGG